MDDMNSILELIKVAMQTYVVSPLLTPWAFGRSTKKSRADGWRVVERRIDGRIVDQLPTETQAYERAADLNARAVLNALARQSEREVRAALHRALELGEV
jgi:hypothetical protein